MELQAWARPLVRRRVRRAHRVKRRLPPGRCGEQSPDGPRHTREDCRTESKRRQDSTDDYKPNREGHGSRTAGTDEEIRYAGSDVVALSGEPREDCSPRQKSE